MELEDGSLERCGPEVSSLGPASAMATLCVAGSVSGSPCGAPCAPAVSSVAHVLATGTGMPGRRSSAHGIVLAAGADMPGWRLHVLDMVGVLHRDSKETFITTTVTSRFYTVRLHSELNCSSGSVAHSAHVRTSATRPATTSSATTHPLIATTRPGRALPVERVAVVVVVERQVVHVAILASSAGLHRGYRRELVPNRVNPTRAEGRAIPQRPAG